MNDPKSRIIDEGLARWLRRRLCIAISPVGLVFSFFVIGSQPTAVAIFGGVPAAASSVLAIASLAAAKKYQAVERAWLAVGLLVFSVVLVIVINVL